MEIGSILSCLKISIINIFENVRNYSGESRFGVRLFLNCDMRYGRVIVIVMAMSMRKSLKSYRPTCC
jgi:hypothetical protein